MRVLVVDDHPIVGEAVRRLLSATEGLVVVAVAADGEQALEVLEQMHPDVVVMDIDMPRLNGIQATRRIVESGARIAVVGLTGLRDDTLVARMKAAGAFEVVQKTAAPATIRAAVLRAGHLDAEPTGHGLSPREREVLRRIAQGQTARKIGEALRISPRTVDKHRSVIMKKLGVRGIAALTEWAIEHGLAR